MFTLSDNLLAGTFGHIVTQSTLVVDNLVASQLVVSLYCRIGVHLKHHGIFPDAGYALTRFVGTGNNVVAKAVGHLYVYGFIVGKNHDYCGLGFTFW